MSDAHAGNSPLSMRRSGPMKIRIKKCPLCSKNFKYNEPVKRIGNSQVFVHLRCFNQAQELAKKAKEENDKRALAAQSLKVAAAKLNAAVEANNPSAAIAAIAEAAPIIEEAKKGTEAKADG